MNPTNGTKFAQVQPAKTGRTESGTFTDVPYETTSFTEAAKIAQMAEVNQLSYDWEQTFGKQKVTLHYPYNFQNDPATEPPVDLWELNSNKVQKSILDAANPLSNLVSQAELFVIGQFQQNKSNYIIVPLDGATPPTVTINTGTGCIKYSGIAPDAGQDATDILYIQSAAGKVLANLISTGVESFDIFTPQLKHAQTVNSKFPIQTPFINVGSIISTQTLYSLENIPNNVLFILPDLANPIPADNTKPVLNYGWYKNAPSVNQIARLKFQIVTTWDYGLWPVALYGNPL